MIVIVSFLTKTTPCKMAKAVAWKIGRDNFDATIVTGPVSGQKINLKGTKVGAKKIRPGSEEAW